MRKKIVAGNWKMNKTFSEGVTLFNEIQKELETRPANNVTTIIFPSFIFINDFSKSATHVFVGTQNCASESAGAYTGEVSASMIKSVGATHVIIGHSERRSYFGETNSILSKKINLALQNSLVPVFCIGETLEERNAKRHFDCIRKQLEEGIFHLSPTEFEKIILAYEPVWAIGTGLTATSAQAQEMHKFIRAIIKEKYGETISNSCSILYGGSCNAQNAKELFACPDVDGGLIGGASLKANDFVQIVHSF